MQFVQLYLYHTSRRINQLNFSMQRFYSGQAG